MDADTLSYDDSLPYDEQLPTTTSEAAASSLVDRIGSTKVYLLSDASSRLGKRKHADADGEGDGDDEMDTDQDPILRANALLLQGPPIAHLPTARLFEYAAHFDVQPLGLEWIDDTTCILVFSSKAAAKAAFLALKKPSDTMLDLSTTELYTARPIPVSLWPPEDRIHHSLGVGQGLRGTVSIRWARNDDKKKRGAKKDSEFYKKHGLDAGKESAGFGVVPASVSANAQASLVNRMGKVGDTLEERIATDDENEKSEIDAVREWDRGKPGVADSLTLEKRLAISSSSSIQGRKRTRDDVDEFLGEDLNDESVRVEGDEHSIPDSPPSKMRSDYIANDGRTLIGSASGRGSGLVDRITVPLPRRARGRRRGHAEEESNGDRSSPGASDDGARKLRSGRRRGRFNSNGVVSGSSEPSRKKTRQELDDELDAFLNSKT